MAGFNVRLQFQNHEEFLRVFHVFCQKNNQPFTIAMNNQKQVTLMCRHGVKPASTNTGKCSHLWYNCLTYGAEITCYKPTASSIVKVTFVNLDHNREVSEAAFESIEVGEGIIGDPHEANCKVGEISKLMKKKFDKSSTTQKIRDSIHNTCWSWGHIDTPKLPRTCRRREGLCRIWGRLCWQRLHPFRVFLCNAQCFSCFLLYNCTNRHVVWFWCV